MSARTRLAVRCAAAVGLAAAATGTLAWGWTALAASLAASLAALTAPRALRRRVWPVALGLALVAILGLAPHLARRLQ